MDGRKNEDDDRRLLVAQDRQVGQFGVGNRDDHVVLGEDLGSFQGDVDLLALLLLDRNLLFEAIVMKTHALDRHIVLASRDSGNVDPVLLVSRINPINNTGARVIETIENNQYGIRMVLGIDVRELETNGAGIHDVSRGGGSSRCRSIDFAIVRVTCDGGECKGND